MPALSPGQRPQLTAWSENPRGNLLTRTLEMCEAQEEKKNQKLFWEGPAGPRAQIYLWGLCL